MGNDVVLNKGKETVFSDINNSELHENYDNLKKSLKIKDKADKAYYEKNYEQAIELYKKVLEINKMTVCYSNIALAYEKQGEYQMGIVFIEKAIELDSNNEKLYRIKGCLLASLAKQEHSILEMQKAIDDFVTALEINESDLNTQNYNKAKKAVFLMKQYKEKTRKNKLIKLGNGYGLNINKFLKLNFYDQKDTVVGENYYCPITLDFMKDPVTTSAGVTYERIALEEFISVKGLIDPTNNTKLSPFFNYASNKAFKTNIKRFLRNNPWALDFEDDTGEWDYNSIEFSIV